MNLLTSKNSPRMQRYLKLLFAPVLLSNAFASAAYADLTLCNRTDNAAGLAVAFKMENMWTSNGWWTIEAGQCMSVISGDLSGGPYYYHAQHYKVGGEWSGDHEFCTDRGSFTIKGRLDCEDRGYVTEDFQEIDTSGQRNWQHDLLPTSPKKTSDQNQDIEPAQTP